MEFGFRNPNFRHGLRVAIVEGGQKMDGEDRPRKSQRRKRASSVVQEAFGATTEERDARLGELRKEREGLFGYNTEVMGKKVVDLDMVTEKQGPNWASAVVALLMEERDLPLSKLVGEIHGEVVRTKEKGVVCCEGLTTVASVKSTVLFVGQRMMYGVPNADADVLEDESCSCLWCWETRDFKLMPQSVRGVLNIHRTCRKRIHERITAVSVGLFLLQLCLTDGSDSSSFFDFG